MINHDFDDDDDDDEDQLMMTFDYYLNFLIFQILGGFNFDNLSKNLMQLFFVNLNSKN